MNHPNQNDNRTNPQQAHNPADESWRTFGPSTTYEEADRLLNRYEEDYRRFEDENRDKPETWWDDAKQDVKQNMRDLREKLASIRDNAGDAWGEMRDAIGAAFAELSTGYRRSIRELKDDHRHENLSR